VIFGKNGNLEFPIKEGENPVFDQVSSNSFFMYLLKSRVVWECSPNIGDRFHLKLNITRNPIADKYCEGKVKRTLKRELKVLEIVKRRSELNFLKKESFEYKLFSNENNCIFF